MSAQKSQGARQHFPGPAIQAVIMALGGSDFINVTTPHHRPMGAFKWRQESTILRRDYG